MVIGVVLAGMENGPVNIVTVVELLLSENGPDVKAGILGVFFHKPSQKGLSSVAQIKKLLPDRLQTVADCLGTVDTGGVKG